MGMAFMYLLCVDTVFFLHQTIQWSFERPLQIVVWMKILVLIAITIVPLNVSGTLNFLTMSFIYRQ